MSWGLPPKYNVEHYISNTDVETINNWVHKALINKGFLIQEDTFYRIEAIKKMPRTFISLFALSRPKIFATILITKKGRVTINSKYDYDSMFGIAMYDQGSQVKQINPLLDEIIDLALQTRKD